jgi:hypothetical protein
MREPKIYFCEECGSPFEAKKKARWCFTCGRRKTRRKYEMKRTLLGSRQRPRLCQTEGCQNKCFGKGVRYCDECRLKKKQATYKRIAEQNKSTLPIENKRPVLKILTVRHMQDVPAECWGDFEFVRLK